MTETVKVMVRCRPMNQKQKERNSKDVITIDSKSNLVSLTKLDSKDAPKHFTFDCVFGGQTPQSVIYQQTAFSLVDSVIEGYNGTIFAYGQTGCGKTHTMMGVNQSEQLKGIIPRTFSQIITMTGSQKDKKHLVQCSFIEIYNEQIHDLLGKDIKAKMQIKQSIDKEVFVKDLTMHLVKTIQQMQKYMEIGFKNRAVRETAMNKQSSRSHSIFTIYIDSSEIDQLGNEKFKAGKLNLVDLAGSERQSKTNATGDGMKEAAKINLSLSALGNVISALVDGKAQHIPYRDSKLTRLLQDSLGGNTKTIMIAAISPADYNYQETLSTLRYASRAKFIQNKPIINEDPKDTLLRQYAQQIKALKLLLQGKSPIKEQKLIRIPNKNSFQLNDGFDDKLLKDQLKWKQSMLKNQQQEKQNLKKQLQNLQKIVGKQNGEENKKEVQKVKKMKEKLKIQRKKQEDYKNQKKKRQEDFLNFERNYKSLNQQVQEMRARFHEIKNKYVANLTEMKDLREEHQREKQELLDNIRAQQSEINKFTNILAMVFTQDQIAQIINQSEYVQQAKEWIIAPFYYRQKSVNFPKLPPNKCKQLVDSQKSKKQIVFKEVSQKEEQLKVKDSFKISQVLKGARDAKKDPFTPDQRQIPYSRYEDRNKAKSQFLNPIKNGESFDKVKIQEKNKVRLDPIQIKNQIMQELAESRKLNLKK